MILINNYNIPTIPSHRFLSIAHTYNTRFLSIDSNLRILSLVRITNPRLLTVVTWRNSHYRIISDMKVKYFVTLPSLNATHTHNEQFLSIIPSSYIYSKNKPLLLYFDFSEFTTCLFIKKISYQVPKDFLYTVFIKVIYNFDSFLWRVTNLVLTSHLSKTFIIYLFLLFLD